MKALAWSFLASVVIVVAIVALAVFLLLPVAGFDVKKYFGLRPILGEPGELSYQFPETQEGSGVIFRDRNGNKIGFWSLDCSWEQTSDGNIIAKCACPSTDEEGDEVYAAACGTKVPDVEGGECDTITGGTGRGQYEDDGIISMYIDDDKRTCVVTGRDFIGDNEQMRKAAVFCSYDTTLTRKEGSWETSSNQVEDWTTPTCDPTSNEFLLFCNSKSNEGSSEDYKDDTHRDYRLSNPDPDYFDPSDPPKNCWIETVDHDPPDDDNQQRKVDAICGNTSSGIVYHYYRSEWIDHGFCWECTHCYYRHYESCPGDSHLISCFSKYHGGWNLCPAPAADRIWVSEIFPYLGNERWVCSVKHADHDCSGRKVTVLCAEQLYHWSSSLDYRRRDDDFIELTISCPSGKAIACATDTASTESWDNYGEDPINDMWIDTSTQTCHVAAHDTIGGDEQKRRVGVLCTSGDGFVYKMGTLKTVSNAGECTDPCINYNNRHSATFQSPECDPGTVPIFCGFHTEWNGGDPGAYGEDHPTSIKADDKRCYVTFLDTNGAAEFKVRVDVMCANTTKYSIERNPSDFSSVTAESSGSKLTYWNVGEAYKCSQGVPTQILTETNSNDDNYEDDYITEIMPNHALNGGIVTTYTPWNDNQARKNGVICIAGLPEGINLGRG